MARKLRWILSITLLLSTLLLAGCNTSAPTAVPTVEATTAAPAETAAPVSDNTAALKLSGLVENELSWSEAEIKALPTLDVQAANSNGETKTYTGVAINDLLALGKTRPEAAKIVFVADDGFTAEVTLAELQACTDCIISFRNQGGFSVVMPNFPKNLQVKGVIEIQVK